MGFTASFIASDLTTVWRAASVAEDLTRGFFDLNPDEWKRNPYELLTRKHVDQHLYEPEAFASVVKVIPGKRYQGNRGRVERFGIVLQDPNILRALLRSWECDLWTLMLFVLTHELVHIIRFRKFSVDFFSGVGERDREEKLVQSITREILHGAPNTAPLLNLYDDGHGREAEPTHQTRMERRL